MGSAEKDKSEKEGWFEDSWLDENGTPSTEAPHSSSKKTDKTDDSSTYGTSPPPEYRSWNRMVAIGKKILEKAREGNLTSGFDSSNASPSSPAAVSVPLLPKPAAAEKEIKFHPSAYEPPFYSSEEEEDEEEEDEERENEFHHSQDSRKLYSRNNSIVDENQASERFKHWNRSNARDDGTALDATQPNRDSFKSRETGGINARDIPKCESFQSEGEKDEALSKASDSCGWKHIVLEVIPVLGVLTIAVLGTFFYYYMQGGAPDLFPKTKDEFSLACSVGNGEWVPSQDNEYYTSSCPYLRDEWNCKKFILQNAYSEVDSVKFKWSPHGCALPSFQPQLFLSVLSGKKLAFVGDKSAANEFDSLICMLAEADTPQLLSDDLLLPYVPNPDEQTPDIKSTLQVKNPVNLNGNENDVESLKERQEEAPILKKNSKFLDWRVLGYKKGRKELTRKSDSDGKEPTKEEQTKEMRENKEDRKDGEKSDGEELYWRGKRQKLSYYFPNYNFTVTMFDSPLLVNTSNTEKVNRTKCQLSKANLARLSSLLPKDKFDSHLVTNVDEETISGKVSMRKIKASMLPDIKIPLIILKDKFFRIMYQKALNVGKYKNNMESYTDKATLSTSNDSEISHSDSDESLNDSSSNDNSGVFQNITTQESIEEDEIQPTLAAAISSVFNSCYPNRIILDEPDFEWSSHVKKYDVLVLNSGREWREEVMEEEGFSIFEKETRQEKMSLEGLSGEWAYPHAMKNTLSWLNDEKNFNGQVIFRSYSSTHQRKECAARVILDDQAIRSSLVDDFQSYDNAVMESLRDTNFVFLNVSLLSAQRADGHPWTSYSVKPKPDCSHWCLPGVPDAWNEILAATLLKMYTTDDYPIYKFSKEIEQEGISSK